MSDELHERLAEFAAYAEQCYDEKGHSQVFLDRLFQAIGHKGYKEAGAVLEDRVRKKGGRTRFVDLSWSGRRVLIEMKRRGEPLAKHFPQLRGYWLDTVGWRARYLGLCNFEELWIYDTEVHTSEPVDIVPIAELAHRTSSIGFLLPEAVTPLFHNNAERVSTEVAATVAECFKSLIDRGQDREAVQRFILQCVVCMFSEDVGLLPDSVFARALADCAEGQNTYDVLGSLFRQMNSTDSARGGRFRDVPYFNGGLFENPEALDLSDAEVGLLLSAAESDWSQLDLNRPGFSGDSFS